MKKAISVLCTLIITFSFISISNAQGIKFGVRAGYNSANWRGETKTAISDMTESSTIFSIKEKPGFYAGFYTQIPLTERIVFEPGLYYSQKGISVSASYPGENFFRIRGTVTNHAHYIDLPLQVKAYLSENFYVYGGPQVSYLVANQVEGRAGALGFSYGQTFDIDNAFRKWDFGLTGGVGLEFNKMVNLQVGYEYGLSKLDDTFNASVYNRVIKAGLGIHF
jgi:opacity protein-like surface antigen